MNYHKLGGCKIYLILLEFPSEVSYVIMHGASALCGALLDKL